MKIQRVLIDGFKNLENVDVTFDSITALAALNNFGKSNFLKGISFGVKFIKAKEDLRMKMLSDKELMPLNKGNAGKNFKFVLDMITNIDKKKYSVMYSFEVPWIKSDDFDGNIISETLKIKKDLPHQKYEIYVQRKGETAFYKSSETGRCSTKIKVDSYELVVNKILSFDSLFYSEIIKKINKLLIYMEDSLDPRRFYDADPIMIKGFGDVMFKDDDLPTVLYKLRKKNPDKFELIQNAFLTLFPNVQELNIKEFKIEKKEVYEELSSESPFIFFNSIHYLYVIDENFNSPLNFDMMSNGSKRILVLITRIVLAKMSSVSLIMIEEPENLFLPSLLNAFLQIVYQLSNDCKVVMTSHSPYIISCLLNNGIYAGISCNGGNVNFKKVITKKILSDSKKIDLSIGDYLFSLLADQDENIKNYLS